MIKILHLKESFAIFHSDILKHQSKNSRNFNSIFASSGEIHSAILPASIAVKRAPYSGSILFPANIPTLPYTVIIGDGYLQ
jgi:hypothetical protein